MIVSEVIIYPLKSARGISVAEAQVEPHGLSGDRVLMLVDEDGRFVSQREEPRLATVSARIDGSSVQLSIMAGPALTLPIPAGGDRTTVTIWQSTVEAGGISGEADARLSAWLGRPVRLVIFDRKSSRQADADWAGAGVPVTFSDGFPLLITTTGSLAALNRDLADGGHPTVPMNRFRPNIVIDIEAPWHEDRWRALRIGGVVLDLVKPCQRCIVPSQDQETGAQTGPGPMPALRRLRRSADPRVKGVIFGWNAVPRSTGMIRTGDEVEVVREEAAAWPLADQPANR